MQEILFYIFSGAMLFFGLLTITSRNAVNSAIYLVLVFFFMAGLFVLLNAFFLAVIQILVYAGAVMVLFLFVIMLLNVTEEEKRKIRWATVITGLSVTAILIIEFLVILDRNKLQLSMPPGNIIGSVEVVGRQLFSTYLVPFEVSSLLLLAAMIGVIVLSKKESKS